MRHKITYRLRDWLFARQRYWGEPIPVIHWEDGSTTTVKEEDLPVILPKRTEIKPSGNGRNHRVLILLTGSMLWMKKQG